MAKVGDINPVTGKRYSPQEIMRVNSGLDPSTGLAAGGSTTTGTSTFKDPVTGAPCTEAEYSAKCASVGITPTTTPTGNTATYHRPNGVSVVGTSAADTPAHSYVNPVTERPFTQEDLTSAGVNSVEEWFANYQGGISGGQEGTTGTMPTFGEGAAAGIPTPEVTPAPPYEISPEQIAFEEMYGGKLTDWVEEGGYGIPEETQAQMIQQQTDTLKAREQENIRVMKNNMERRGITNSGYVQANMNMITSNTTVALAGAIADVQIKSALMRMASFEKAMGAAAQFLGYLSEQSQLAYAPEFATWQAEQMAKMATWQGKLDVYKMELNQAYQTQNLTLQAQLQSQLNAEQNAFDIQMLEIEIDATQQAAQAEGIGSIIGTILGIGASLLFGVPLFGF